MPVVGSFNFSLRFTGSLSNTSGTGSGTFNINTTIIPLENQSYGTSFFDVTDQTSNGATSDDTFASPNITYAGFTLNFGGNNYAVFIEPGGGPFPDVYYVPHDNALNAFFAGSPTSFPYTFATGTFPENYCFLEGTHIKTPGGERLVETLQVGDLVSGPDGREMAVKWNGRQTISTRFGPAERLRPVRIATGALGGGLPARDLFVTADHAILVDDLLINAGALVNGNSIDFVPMTAFSRDFTVYSIELDQHDIVVAEGAPCESFVDYAGRRSLDNYADYVALYGDEQLIRELDIPRVSASRLVPSDIKDRLARIGSSAAAA